MPHVVIHVVLLARERLLAYVATMRGLTGMFADVVLHVLPSRKRLGTVLTPATDYRRALQSAKAIAFGG